MLPSTGLYSMKNWNIQDIPYIHHCVKSVQIWSYFWSVFSCIRTEYRKIWTRKNSVFGHFHAVHVISLTLKKCLWYCRHVLRHWIHQTLSVGTQSVINSEGCYIVSLFIHFLFVLENNCRKKYFDLLPDMELTEKVWTVEVLTN